MGAPKAIEFTYFNEQANFVFSDHFINMTKHPPIDASRVYLKNET